jgi:hypothetical protein
LEKEFKYIVKAFAASHNRPVSAQARKVGLTPPLGGSGYKNRSDACVLCAVFLR